MMRVILVGALLMTSLADAAPNHAPVPVPGGRNVPPETQQKISAALKKLESTKVEDTAAALKELEALGAPGQAALDRYVVRAVDELKSPIPKERERAERALDRILPLAAPAMRAARLQNDDPEQSRRIDALLKRIGPERYTLDEAAVAMLSRLKNAPVTAVMAEVLEGTVAALEKQKDVLAKVKALESKIDDLQSDQNAEEKVRKLHDERKKLLESLKIPGAEEPWVRDEATYFTVEHGKYKFEIEIKDGELAVGPPYMYNNDFQGRVPPDWFSHPVTSLFPATKDVGFGKSVSNELVVESRLVDTRAVEGNRVVKGSELVELDAKKKLRSVQIPFKLTTSIPPEKQFSIRFLRKELLRGQGGEVRGATRDMIASIARELFQEMVDPKSTSYSTEAADEAAGALLAGDALQVDRKKK